MNSVQKDKKPLGRTISLAQRLPGSMDERNLALYIQLANIIPKDKLLSNSIRPGEEFNRVHGGHTGAMFNLPATSLTIAGR